MKKLLIALSLFAMMLMLCACHEHVWIRADCENPKTCETCGETEGEAKGHSWVEATCTSPKTCSACGATEGKALGHEWQDATCTAPKTCSTCGETTGKVEHAWEEASCTVARTCTLCGELEGAPLGHIWDAATCTTAKTCSTCGELEGEALGHQWEGATCTVPKMCERCGKTEGSALGHDWKAANCTTPRTCSACGKTEGSAKGHQYNEGEIVVVATCSHSGTIKYTCEASSCGHQYSEEYNLRTYSATEIYNMSIEYVGEIIVYDKQGNELGLATGFVVSSDGKIITNYHVIEGAYSAKITINNKAYTIAAVLAYDENIDLAVLKINASGLKYATICKEPVNVGETVYAIGSSRGMTNTCSQGIVTYAGRIVDGVSHVQHDASITHGNSGGPLINAYGEVIGINTWGISDSQNLNFAVFTDELDNLTYGAPMSLAELYDSAYNPFYTMVAYIVGYGTYDYEDACYYLVLGSRYSNDYSREYKRIAYYYMDSNVITLDLRLDNGDSIYYVYFVLDENLDGMYDWYYFDNSDYEMEGTIIAASYDENTLLGYSYHNLPTTSLKDVVRDLASLMVDELCWYFDSDFEDVGVTAADIGFYCY